MNASRNTSQYSLTSTSEISSQLVLPESKKKSFHIYSYADTYIWQLCATLKLTGGFAYSSELNCLAFKLRGFFWWGGEKAVCTLIISVPEQSVFSNGALYSG